MAERTIRRAADKPELADAIASEFIRVVAGAIRQRGTAHVALTGGSMGSAFLEALGRAGAEQVDWTKVHLWWGDERFLAHGDADRNDVQADAALLSSLTLSPERVHRVASPDETALADAATRYATDLASHAEPDADWPAPVFDIVMLGMGPDTHVASLFPGFAQTTLDDVTTAAVEGSPKPPPQRVTMTFPTLNNSRQVWLMIAGADKADAVAAAFSANDRTAHPASAVAGQEHTIWWVDDAAATALPDGS